MLYQNKYYNFFIKFIVNGPIGQVGLSVTPKMMELEIGLDLKSEMPQNLSTEECFVRD